MSGNQEEVKLLGHFISPFVCRAQIALRWKGVDFDFLEQDLFNKSEELIKYNPVHKKVPVLVHNGKSICESLVIVEYIDETWKGNPILPTDPYHRAQARFWAKFIDDKVVLPSYRSVFTINEDEGEKNMKDAIEALQFLENELKEKKFFGGEEVGFVDIVAVYIALWIPMIQEIGGLQLLTSEKFPKLCKWSQEFLAHPIVKETVPLRDQISAFYKGRYEMLFADK